MFFLIVYIFLFIYSTALCCIPKNSVLPYILFIYFWVAQPNPLEK